MDDWKAKVVQAEEGEERTVAKHLLIGGARNDNGEQFVNFCVMNDLVVTSTVFLQTDIHKNTWTSLQTPD